MCGGQEKLEHLSLAGGVSSGLQPQILNALVVGCPNLADVTIDGKVKWATVGVNSKGSAITMGPAEKVPKRGGLLAAVIERMPK